MYCKYCGSEIKEGDKFCPKCGREVITDSQDSETQPSILSNENMTFSNNKTVEKQPAYMVSSMVCGILSIIFSSINYLGIPFVHLIGIALGIIGISLAQKDKKECGSYSKSGLITGIIGLSLGGLAFIIGFISGLLSA